MSGTVIEQLYAWLAGRQSKSVERRSNDTAIDPIRICDRYFIARGSMSEHQFESRPMLRNTGTQHQVRSLQMKAENGFERGTIHPARGAGVPGPPAAAR